VSNQSAGIKTIFLADDNREDCLVFEKAIIDIDVHIRNLLYTNQNKRDYNSNAYVDNISSIGNIISSTSFSLFFWECLCTIEYVYEYEFVHEYVNDN